MDGRNPVSLSRLPWHGRNNKRFVFCGPFKVVAFLFIYSCVQIELKHKNTQCVSSPKGWFNWQLWLRTCTIIPVACVHMCTCCNVSAENMARFRREKQQPHCVSTCVFPAGGRLILQHNIVLKLLHKLPHRFCPGLTNNHHPDGDGRTEGWAHHDRKELILSIKTQSCAVVHV